MATIGRHVSKLSGYAPALPTPFDAMTVMGATGVRHSGISPSRRFDGSARGANETAAAT